MSYRIYLKLKINDFEKEYQAFGNNECPDCVIKEFKKQGAKIDTEDCFEYFEIKDLSGLIKATEAYIVEEYLEKKRTNHNIADFAENFEDGYKNSAASRLTSTMLEIMDYAYIFASANILKFIGEKNYEVEYTLDGPKYHLKKGVYLFAKGN